MNKKCQYKKTRMDGYGTDWNTSCGHSLRMEAPIEAGFSFAPLPNADGKYCSWCGNLIDIAKEKK